MDENEELENQNQEQNRNRFDGSSISNPATNIATKAQNVQKVANQMSKTLAKNEKRKSQAQILAKVAKNAGKVSNVAAKLAPVITVAAIIILIIIFLIGIVTFIITGFGYIMAGLQKTVGGILDCISGTFSGDENNVHKETIVDTLTYIKELGYDLYGYGFVTKEDALKEETTEEEVTDDQGNKSTVSTSNYSLNYKTDDEAYRYVNSYIVSDNYASLIKNSNKNFKTAFSSFSNFFSGWLDDKTEWGSGLLSIYYQDPKKGGNITGKKYEGYDPDYHFTTNPIGGLQNAYKFLIDGTKISVNNGKLQIRTRWFD